MIYVNAISLDSKANWKDPKYRRKMKKSNRSSDPEVRAKIAASVRAYWKSKKS